MVVDVGPDGPAADAHTTALLQVCDDMGLHVSPAAADRAVELHARVHSFNLLRDGLLAMADAWDGVPRVDRALSTYWRADDTPATRATSRVFLLSLAARGITPGAKVDTCPILVAGQGQRKSSSLAALVGREFFSDSELPLGDKDAAQAIRGKWLWEFGESSTLASHSVEKVKAFLSTQVDRFRQSYGRHTQDIPRTCTFVATSNRLEVLNDPTGARRFMPVIVGYADVEAIDRDRVQLLGEAARRVLDGEQHWPTELEDAALSRMQEAATETDAWETPISDWLDRREADGKGAFALRELFDVFGGALALGIERVSKREQMRACAVLHRLGYGRVERTRGAGQRREWLWAKMKAPAR